MQNKLLKSFSYKIHNKNRSLKDKEKLRAQVINLIKVLVIIPH